jgi:hypothetical protein
LITGRERPNSSTKNFSLGPAAGLLALFLARLEYAQALALGLGVQAGDGLAQGQRFVAVIAEALGDHGRPQRHDWGTVDFNGWHLASPRLACSTSILPSLGR